LPERVQPLIAALVLAALLAMAGWYLVQGGPWGGLVHHDAPPAAGVRFTVDVNRADVAELAQLPGLGATTAARIVDHRRVHGPFASVEALLAVPGIGPATLDGLRPHLREPRAAAGERP